ncbi:hypothetical protein Y886_24220 [Xanthomonas hyacinthi DSM 19077]|nr:hypothetical protein Y886_24220 [Xanthomonas hyacinthi DSM 19077]
MEHIWQRTSLSRRQFDTLYRTPLQRYAVLVQQFPASESRHHADHGGMLEHGVADAVSLVGPGVLQRYAQERPQKTGPKG